MRTEITHSIEFGADGNAAEYQLYGWSGGEDGFTWTLGRESAVILPRRASPHGFFVEIALGSISADQSMKIAVNGVEICAMDGVMNGLHAFRAVEPHWQDNHLVITIFHPDAIPADERLLALAVRRIRILRIIEPWESIPFVPGVDFLSSFESLGVNCELGFVQRHAGIEPMGLLRFSGSFPEHTVKGIDTDWHGLVEERNILPFDTGTEWHVHHWEYALDFHTFIKSSAASAEQIQQREMKRLAFLSGKLARDIGAAEKIFVLQRAEPLSYAEVLPVFLALRRRGPCFLLWLTSADDDHPAGYAEVIESGLLRGYLGRFSPPGRHYEPDIESWMTVLRTAYALIAG